jgi:hypothetical protein
MSRFVSPYVCAFFALSACSFDDDGAGGGESTGTSGIGTVSASSSPSGDDAPTTVDDEATGPESGSAASNDGSTGTTSAADSGSAGSDTSVGTSATGNDPGGPVDCSGTVYACGDEMDNDGDGHIDLNDPECTGPCDDDEGSYQTGIPGDNMDCKQDCFFDGNSGQGDDGCIWSLKCDPANPGEFIGCAYTGGNNCENSNPPNQTEECIMFCEQFVPPGCDCFGCCTVQTPDGPVDIFLNGDPDCSLDNLDACTSCTSQIEECGNPCVPEECEICFGETEPPEGCGENSCEGDLPCDATPDCPVDYFCYLGCCFPPPPG